MLRRLVIGFWPSVMGGMPGELHHPSYSPPSCGSLAPYHSRPSCKESLAFYYIVQSYHFFLGFKPHHALTFLAHVLTYIPVPAGGS